MKRFAQLVCFILICGISLAQNTAFKSGRYRITFDDKHETPYSVHKPYEFLSERAIERRVKYNIDITEQDLPITPRYLEELSALGAKLCNSSKWFNSAIYLIETDSVLKQVQQKAFVTSVDYVAPKMVYIPEKRKLAKQGELLPEISVAQTLRFEKRDANSAQNMLDVYGKSIEQNLMLGTVPSHLSGHLGQGKRIAVVDAGFLHVDSAAVFQKIRDDGRLIFTRDVTGTDKWLDTIVSIYDEGSHGMQVLSLIGGFLPGQLIGTAPMAEFILIKSEESETEYAVEEDNWVAAAELADSAGVDIISTSLGYSTFDDESQNYTYAQMNGNTSRIAKAANIASSKGMLLLNSAGNSGNEKWKYITTPADAELVLTVGACKINNRRAKFSSVGPTSDQRIKPDVMALGFMPTIVLPNGLVRDASAGTSFACPLVAGCCATLWEEFPDSSAQAIKFAVQRSGDRQSKPNNRYGYGTANVCKARYIMFAMEFYKFLSTKYKLPEFEQFAETFWQNNSSRIVGDFTFVITTAKGGEEKVFSVRKHNYRSIELPEIAEKDAYLTVYTSNETAKSVRIFKK